jgi:hypothetical protein
MTSKLRMTFEKGHACRTLRPSRLLVKQYRVDITIMEDHFLPDEAQERGDHHGDALGHEGGQLIAEGLPGTGPVDEEKQRIRAIARLE